MMESTPLKRWEELLSDRTGGCLPHAERRELEALLAEHPDVDPYEYEEAAGVLLLSMTRPAAEPMPASLRMRLQASADAWFAGRPATAPPAVAVDTRPAPRGRLLSSPWSGWTAAAAAGLIAVGVWVARPSADPTADVASARLALLKQDAIGYWEFAATEDPWASGAGGDVVWDNDAQVGYMRFAGLQVNDPTEEQYQLWIFDGSRTSSDPDEVIPPIDGGVFDVGPGGEVIVPIDPKLVVGSPTLFAITLEEPGGVVVSKQEHVLLVASTQS